MPELSEREIAEQEINEAAIAEVRSRLTAKQVFLVDSVVHTSWLDRNEKIEALNAALALLKYGGISQ